MKFRFGALVLSLVFFESFLIAGDIFRDKEGIWYRISGKEDLIKVSYKFGVKLQEIMKINNRFSPKDVNSGDLIFVPIKSKKMGFYKKYPFIGDEAFRDDDYDFVWPTYGVITWFLEKRRNSLHLGIDIAAPIGTYIRAAKDGIVRYANWAQGYGRLIILKHDKLYETRYGHCSKLLVEPGEKVRKGQLIALVGSTGFSSGPHLHFEIRYDNIPLQPIHFLKPVAKFFRLKLPNLAYYRNLIEAQREALSAKK